MIPTKSEAIDEDNNQTIKHVYYFVLVYYIAVHWVIVSLKCIRQ